MLELPTEWGALVLLLGMRHGLDADHLASIDGLTRWNSLQRRPFARYCGLLFSLGHGTVVLLIAAGVGLLTERWRTPPWLEVVGAWLSITCLLLIAGLNLRALRCTAPDQPVVLVGLKGRLLGRLAHAHSPAGVATVGALFALSFDTVSQAALFAATGTQWGGVAQALTLGLLFMLGMLATDGLNGWWIAHLVRRADQGAVRASRVMSLAVAGVSLLVALLGVGRQLTPAVQAWAQGKELMLGSLVLAVVLGSYGLAKAWRGPRTLPSR